MFWSLFPQCHSSIFIMKSLLLLCVFLVARIQDAHALPEPQKDDFKLIIGECRTQTGYTDEVLDEEETSGFIKDEGLRKMNDCFLKKVGFVTRDGELNIGKAPPKRSLGFAKPIIKRCKSDIAKKKIDESVSDFSSCYHQGVVAYYINNIPKLPFNADYYHGLVKECRSEAMLTDTAFEKEEKTNFKEDTTFKKFNRCFLEKTDFFTSDGSFGQFDFALAKLTLPWAKMVIEECKMKLTKFTGDTAPEFFDCFHRSVIDYARTAKRQGVYPYTFQRLRLDSI